MAPFPGGTVTFLYLDVPDSAALWSQPSQTVASILDCYTTIVEAAVTAHDGVLFERRGPLLGAAFANALAAVTAARAAHHALGRDSSCAYGPIQARMALHTGVVAKRTGTYMGRPEQWVRLLLAAGHAGQILLSQVTQALVRDHLSADARLRDLGAYYLGKVNQSEHLFQLVIQDQPADFPPLHLPARRPNNLPVPPTPLIGREREVMALKATLQRAEVHLLTLIGPGGVGKTRLGLQVAADLHMAFADGVFFVDLSSVRDPALVVPTIAHTLGVTEGDNESLLAHLSDHLADKQQLLLLDNFEQVQPAAPALATLLAAAPNLKLLVTSRTALHLRGEHEFHVAPLALPQRHRERVPAPATSYGAVALFVQRTRAVKPDLVITDELLPLVVEICRRLDGLPLAIELAAARVNLFPLPTLLQHLSRRLPLLTGGAHDLPARQRTLRDTLDWSYQLLDREVQTLFQHLAVFEGGFTLDAAETVCTTRSDRPGQVLSGLAALLDQSLLVQVEQSTDMPRFKMLDTIHEYALEQLERSGDAGTLRQRHATYFLHMAEQAEPEFWGRDMCLWLDRMDEELPNLRAVLAWTLAQREAEIAARLASALVIFWSTRAHRREGRACLETTLASATPLPLAVRAKTLYAAGILARELLDHKASIARLKESVAAYQELGDELGLTVALTDLGAVLAMFGGDQASAKALLDEGLARYRALGNQGGLSWALHGLGWVELHRVLGDCRGYTGVLADLDAVERHPGDLSAARRFFEQSLALWRRVGQANDVAWSLRGLALVAAAQGDYQAARAFAEERLTIERSLNSPHGIVSALQSLGRIAFRQGDMAAADTLLQEGLALAGERSDKYVIGLLMVGLGEARHAAGELPQAKTLFEEALTHFQAPGDQRRMARVTAWLAQVALDQEDDAKARSLAMHSLALARPVTTPETSAACLAGLADSAAGRGKEAWAACLWGVAERHLEATRARLSPVEPANRQSLLESTRTFLGDVLFARAWAAGRALTPEDAIASLDLALSPPALADAAPALALSPLPANLTPREYDVLLLVAAGLSNAAIARRLVITVGTVKTHLTAVYRKLGVSSRLGAMRYVVDHRLQ